MCAFARADRPELLRTLAKSVNAQFSADYAAVADALAFTDEIAYYDYEERAGDCTLTLLVYEYDLSLTLAVPGEGVWSVFLIGMKSLANDIDGAYVEAFAASLGVNGMAYTIYDSPSGVMETELSVMDSKWSRLVRAVARSEKTVRQLLPELYKGEMFNQKTLARAIASAYLTARSESPATALQAARFIAEEIEPIGQQHTEDSAQDWRYVSYETNSIFGACENPPALTAERDFDPSGKILTLYEKVNDNGSAFSYEYMLQSALPLQNIPESPEDADYILLVRTEWTYDRTSNNIKLYRADTAVTLHDAATGALVMDVCQQSDNLEGFTMVSSNSYRQSVRFGRLLPKIQKKLFPENP